MSKAKSMFMQYNKIIKKDLDEWLTMANTLWPKHSKSDLRKEFKTFMNAKKYANFICRDDSKNAIGFINLSLRSDYVQSSSSSPVCYIEGVYVKPEYRKQGVAKELIKLAAKWGKQKGCREIGSDAENTNLDSQKFHKKLGFKATKIVTFIKKIA